MAIPQDVSRLAEVAAAANLTVRRWNPDTGNVELSNVGVDRAIDFDPDLLVEVRRPASHKGKSSFAGRLPVPTRIHEVRAVWFESLNEYHHYLDLLLTRPVVAMASQPLEISWSTVDGSRAHVPDAVIEETDGSRTLIDITTADKLFDPRVMTVFQLTDATAAAMGWRYELRTELPPQREHNLRFVWAHRTSPDRTAELRELVSRAVLPQSVRQLARTLGADVKPNMVWSAVAAGCLGVDLDRPLREDTQITRSQPTRRPPWLVAL